MKLLLHPLVMPLYAFLLYMEIERQSYVFDYKAVLWLTLMLAASFACVHQLTYQRNEGRSPLTDLHSSLTVRIINAAALLVIIGVTTFSIIALRTYTWGARHVLTIFILPTLLNIISGDATARFSSRLAKTFFAKCNAAPSTFIGAFSAFTIIVGSKTGIDTFWPFVITLLMMALRATFINSDDDGTTNDTAAQIYWYAIGIIQAVALMLLFF